MADDALAQQIGHLRADMRDDLGEIKAQLGALLPREVYEVRHQQIRDRVDALEKQRDEDARQRRSDRRWVIGAVVVPAVVLIVQIVISLRGQG